MTGERLRDWVKWIPMAEWWYNTLYHTITHTSLYEAVYSQTPPIHKPYFLGNSKVKAVNKSLQAREAAINLLKFHLQRAQHCMKQQANKKKDRQVARGWRFCIS